MSTLISRPLGIMVWVLLAWGALQIWTRADVKAGLRAAHNQNVVLFGDSHVGDVRLPRVFRFSQPGQDLVGSWMWMEAFERAGGLDSKVKAVVFTVWPNKFVPLSERRLSGRVQKDGWGKSVLGQSGPVLAMDHMMERALPWRLRWRLWLYSFQFRQGILTKSSSCGDESVAEDYGFKMGTKVVERSWFEEAVVSRWAFERMVALAESSGWHLVLLELPLHPSYLTQVNPQAMGDYEAAMRSAAEHPNITYVDMARDSLSYTAFRDYNHLTCEGVEKVTERLYPLLLELGVNL